MSSNLDFLDRFEVGKSFFELIEFSLIRHLPTGETMEGIYGVNVGKVREVVHMPKINPLASRIPGVAGIFELRGVPIPAINLCNILGDLEAPITPSQQIIVTEFSEKRAGFIVSSTHRIRRVSWDKVLPPSTDGASCMSGMILIEDNEFLFILDLEKILHDIESNHGNSNTPNVYSSPYSMEEPTQSAPPPDLNSPGILFVDDSQLILKNVSRTLQNNGYRVLTAENGVEALEKLVMIASGADESFGKLNMVITDVEMPQMDGFTLIRRLREHSKFGNIPVLLHSSLSGEVSQTAGETVGADGYVVKKDLKQLISAVKDLLIKRPFSLGA